jgi:hypothetical protein
MAIEDRNLTAGTRLVATYKGKAYVCVVEGEENGLAFVLDGQRYKSASSVAMAVMGGKAVNGWRFWSLEGGSSSTAATEKKQHSDGKRSGRAKTKAKERGKPIARLITPHANQEDLAEGEVRYWCMACQDAFTGFGSETPERCPQGHSSDDTELTAA